MYNGTNVQPQTYNTGHGGSDAGEPITPALSVPPNELPAPTPGNFHSVPNTPLPTPVNQAGPGLTPHTNSPEHWINEVEQLFSRTTQSPRQRADELSELRRRYQQEVLGITQKGRED
jgi:hypothetical protein